MKNTMFDASPYSAGLHPTYDPTHTHFTYLEDGEIKGGGLWMAQPGENLHVTIQNTNHSVVAHYFYNKSSNSWRYHAYGGGPVPYGNHTHHNLKAVQKRAIDFAWPPGNVVVKVVGHSKPPKKERRQRQKEFENAKKTRTFKLDDLFDSEERNSKVLTLGSFKPVRFPEPPSGRITKSYVQGLIDSKDHESLLWIYKSPDWPLAKWEQDAWVRFLEWVTGPDSPAV